MNIIKKQCANCGRTFLTRDSGKVFCDVRCEDYAKDGIKVEEQNFHETETYVSRYKVCLYCGERFKRRPGEFIDTWEARRFCCRPCATRFRLEAKK